MKPSLVVLDIAGTTVADDDAVVTAFKQSFKSHGFDVSDHEVKPLMGYKKTSAIEMILLSKTMDADPGLIDSIHDEFVDKMIMHYKLSPDVRAADNAEELFVWLKTKGVRVALNTGFPRVIADAIVSRLQWKEKELIDEYIASDEVVKGRPYPYMIDRLMQSANIRNAKEVMKVGDTEVDINEGRNAQCGAVIGITTGAFTRAKLQAYHPDHIIDNLAELQELIH
jgi:phosphonatase-like hydrolase